MRCNDKIILVSILTLHWIVLQKQDGKLLDAERPCNELIINFFTLVTTVIHVQ